MVFPNQIESCGNLLALKKLDEGIPRSFITHLERAKYEKRMRKGKELEVPEDSEIVKSFLHKSDPFQQLYQVGNMLKILPKRHCTNCNYLMVDLD